MTALLDLLPTEDGLTMLELLALRGKSTTSKAEFQAVHQELAQLILAGQALMMPVSRINDDGYRRVVPGFRKKTA